MNYKIFSFFSGVGFLDYGFESENFDIVYANEVHKPFLDAYKYARKNLDVNEPEFGYYDDSITNLLTSEYNAELSDFVSQSRNNGSLVGFAG